MDEFEWFKKRQNLFGADDRCLILPIFQEVEQTIKLQFDVRNRIKKLLQNTKNDLLDTILYYLDTEIEDLQSVLILCKRGFFSSPASILRRLLITLGRIAYLKDEPNMCNTFRKGQGPTDRELMDCLRKKRILSDDDPVYTYLCEATHVNFKWALLAKQVTILSKLNQKSYLFCEGVILSAQKIVLESLRLMVILINCKSGDVDEIIVNLDHLSDTWKENNESFKSNRTNFFDMHL